jgi:hypothetical protein
MKRERFPQRVIRFLDGVPVGQPARGLPLAFVHINKTAGTTFTEYLRSHFVGRQAVAPPFFGDYEQIGVHDASRELYWGHFPYAQFAQHRPDAWFITFLREPVQRVISQYRSLHNPANLNGGWDKVLPPHARRALEFAQRSTFEQFVMSEDPFILGHIQDLQTRFLSSHPDPQHPEFLSTAVENLEHQFLFFGTTESFAESIELFRFQLGSHEHYQAERHQRNVSRPYPIDLDERTEQRVSELVQHDLCLYQYATGLLAQRFELMRQMMSDRRAA